MLSYYFDECLSLWVSILKFIHSRYYPQLLKCLEKVWALSSNSSKVLLFKDHFFGSETVIQLSPVPNPHFHSASILFQFTFSYLLGHASSVRVVHAVSVISIILQVALSELRCSSCPCLFHFQELMHPFEYPKPTRPDLDQPKHLQVIGLHSFELQLDLILHLELTSF